MDQCRPPFFSAFYTLAVDDACRRAGLSLDRLSALDVERMMNTIQRPIVMPQAEVVVHRTARRQVLRKVTPLASRAQHVHHAIHHRAYVNTSLPTPALARRDERANKPPFIVGKVTRIDRKSVV